ncbi:MAG: biotin--[Oscillospiraceae bacterium]|nr:biotin--[acetyl-CoA-carboxylase] ligase [Oscillospiraceae bacterium]
MTENTEYRRIIAEKLQKPVPLEVYASAGSTNDLLRAAAEQGAPEGTVIAAQQQTAGRGRQGRSFFSPPGTGLYLSMLLKPKGTPEQILSVTPMAAVAAAQAIARCTGKEAEIKWVNDLLLGGKKICGILAESQYAAGKPEPDYVILGIGINLLEPPGGFPEALREIAGSVYPTDADPKAAFCDLCAALIDALTAQYEMLPQRGYLAEYRARLCVLNRRITVCENGIERPAVALAADDDLRLLVRYADGTEQWRATGEIRIRLM